MQKWAIGMPANHQVQHHKGFSLIEILVVLLIIGITLGFALLAFGDFGEKRRIVNTAEQFKNYVKLVQQQAILETSTLGIQITQQGYRVFFLDSAGKWQPMPPKGIFRNHLFPDKIVTHFRETQGKHHLIITLQASGDMSAFKLDFGTQKKADIVTVIGDQDGELTLKTEPSS